MDSGSLHVLVEAKKEYLKQLCSIMIPIVHETFVTMYEEARNMSNNNKVLVQFQLLLKEVPNWNEHIISTHDGNLSNKCAWFSDLLAAVFVSFVKILSSVRLKAENKKIGIKLPSNKMFIHKVYINAANDIYNDPYVFNTKMDAYERERLLFSRYNTCIEKTVDDLIPVQEILKSCMSDVTDRIDVESNADTTQTEDPDVYDEEEPEEENNNPEEENNNPEESAPPPMDVCAQEEEEEVKDIPTGPQPPQKEEEVEEEECLFADAPEQIKKS